MQSLLSAICPAGITFSAIWIISTVYDPLHLLFCGWLGADTSHTNICFIFLLFFPYPFALLFLVFLRVFCRGRGGDAIHLDRHAFIYYVRFTVKRFSSEASPKELQFPFLQEFLVSVLSVVTEGWPVRVGCCLLCPVNMAREKPKSCCSCCWQ